MAKCNQWTSLPFKGVQSINSTLLLRYGEPRANMSTQEPAGLMTRQARPCARYCIKIHFSSSFPFLPPVPFLPFPFSLFPFPPLSCLKIQLEDLVESQPTLYFVHHSFKTGSSFRDIRQSY